MSFEPSRKLAALTDFRQARRQAALKNLVATVTGRSTELLSFETVTRQLKLTGSAERGLREIPLSSIAGSVGRTNDYTRDFLPRRDDDEERWARVRAAATDPESGGMAPIQVYQVGEAYFVIDGHHRVSVAHQLGATHITDYVTEIQTRASLSANADPEELIVKAQYADLLDKTRLDQSRPGADLSVTVAGQAENLLAQIVVNKLARSAQLERDVSLPDAAADWYTRVYLPVVYVIREMGLLRDFPNRTEADLYLMVTEHRQALEAETGWKITTEAGAGSLAAVKGGRAQGMRRKLSAMVPDELRDGPVPGEWRRDKLTARYSDRLFSDILVPLSGNDASWRALDQSLSIAQQEAARLHGLLVVASDKQKSTGADEEVRQMFSARCHAAGVDHGFAIEIGDVAKNICARAALCDLVVLSLSHAPASGRLARLGSGLRTIIRRSPRPILTVPNAASIPKRALLAFDGSPKAHEALFVAAYLAEAWGTELVILTVLDGEHARPESIEHARQYLEMHELAAKYIMRKARRASGAIVEVCQAEQCDFIVIGGYGAAPMIEVMVGSQVDHVLRGSPRPVLICR
jgi:nucleotide-binding universal stress UspA family protein